MWQEERIKYQQELDYLRKQKQVEVDVQRRQYEVRHPRYSCLEQTPRRIRCSTSASSTRATWSS